MITLDENRIEIPISPKHIFRIVERCFEELALSEDAERAWTSLASLSDRSHLA